MSDVTIPEAVMNTARSLSEKYGDEMWTSELADEIARAILAERKRCAEITKRMLVFADTTSGADEAIPDAIMDPNHWLAKNPQAIRSSHE